MTDTAMTSAERIKRLDMECVHLRRKLDDANRRADWLRDRLRERRSHRISAKERRILDMWPRYGDTGEPVEVGDVVADDGGEPLEITGVKIMSHTFLLVDDRTGRSILGEFGATLDPPAQSAVDADGVEIHRGDTVYDGNGEPFTVTSILGGRLGLERDGFLIGSSMPASQFKVAHRDSWEQLEEDAADLDDMPCELNAKDLVRRAKALAGVVVDQ